MSMSDYIYIGAFAECRNKVITTPVMGRRCENSKCGRYLYGTKDIFCGWCGTPTEEYEANTKSRASINVWDIEINDVLSCVVQSVDDNQLDYWIPNIPIYDDNADPVEMGFDAEKTQAIEYPHERTMKHIDNFERGYSDALETLRQAYGAENVNVRWGIVCYTM